MPHTMLSSKSQSWVHSVVELQGFITEAEFPNLHRAVSFYAHMDKVPAPGPRTREEIDVLVMWTLKFSETQREIHAAQELKCIFSPPSGSADVY